MSEGSANRAESPEWMPAGDYVVASIGDFRGRKLPKLKMFHVDGGSGIELVSEPDNLKMVGPAVSPDGQYIWYARRTGDWTYNAQFPQYQLEAYELKTGERYARSSRFGSAIRPALSPNGRWLVFGTRHDDHTGLILRDLETSEERWLAYPVQHDDQESRATLGLLPGMSFTPDSQSLVVSYGGRIWRIPVQGGEADEVPFQVEFDLALGPRLDFDYAIEDTPTFIVRQLRDAVPSPDGTRLAFTALDHLWVSAADGSDPERLTEGDTSEHFPVWSPDGEWIAYSTWDGREGHLYKVIASGDGDPVRLTQNAAAYFSPAWGPGDRIVAERRFSQSFESQGEGGTPSSELVWISASPDESTGSPLTLLAPSDGRSDAHFVEGSERIFLFKRPDLLVSIRWDGTDEEEHLRVRGPTPTGAEDALTPSIIKMAPLGDQALVEVQRQIYTVTVPPIGTTPTISVSDPEDASVPARRITDIGGEFAVWAADGRTVHWSLGNAQFAYDLDEARAFEDSVAAFEGAEDESEDEEGESEEAAYRASEFRVLVDSERDLPTGLAVLRGGRAITMDGEEVIENADIVIRDNRIEAVGPTGTVTVPPGASVIDLSGRTVMPGFVDTHGHLRARDELHRTDVWPYLANLAYGITTTRDPQTGNTEVLSNADMVRAGRVIGPRIYSTGPGLFWEDEIDTANEAKDVLRRYSEYFDTKTIKMYVAATREGRQHIIMAARELGLMPTTEGALNIKQNLTETLDGYPGLEHSIPIYPVYDDFVRLFVETGRARIKGCVKREATYLCAEI